MHVRSSDITINAIDSIFLNGENYLFFPDIKTKSFNFIMAQTFYESSEGSFSPAEIAVAKFSFQEGVYKIYHTYVNPGTDIRD